MKFFKRVVFIFVNGHQIAKNLGQNNTKSNVTPNTTSNIRKVLGIAWVTVCNEFIFNFIINTAHSLDCRKRSVFKITAMFHDPIRLLYPTVLQLKLLFTKI